VDSQWQPKQHQAATAGRFAGVARMERMITALAADS